MMEVLVRNRCWDCFGLETTCSICNDTGLIEKWISITELSLEIQKFTPAPLSDDGSITITPPEYIEIPPNINI